MRELQGRPIVSSAPFARAGGPRVKVCCIGSAAEADMAIALGVDAIGLVSAMPSGPGVVGESVIAEIVAHVAGRVKTVLLTALVAAQEIVAQARRLKPAVIQLVDAVDTFTLDAIREQLPDTLLMPVLHVPEGNAFEVSRRLACHSDMLLLDSGNPFAAVRELGGTGRTHDWSVSKRIVDENDLPVFLAGGLNRDNVRAALNAVRPFGVDVCSGVRTEGRLDETKLTEFMRQCRT